MAPEKQIDMLIDSGWKVLGSDFSEQAFRNWRERAYECLNALLGKSHPYTKHFEHHSEFTKRMNILSGVGILTAATMWQLDDDVTIHERWSGEDSTKNHESSIHNSTDVLSDDLHSEDSEDVPVNGWIYGLLSRKQSDCLGENTLSGLEVREA